MLKKIVKFFKALNSNSKPSEIAHALCLGFMLGFIPKNNALWFLIFVFFSFVRINKAFYFITMLVVSCFAGLLDPVFHTIGLKVLCYEPLGKIFSHLIDIPFVGFTKFNNTIVMGAFVFSLLIYIPCFIAGIFLIKLWRAHASSLFARTPISKLIAKLPFAEKIVEFIRDKSV
ncbi:TIGR03546 family protein [Treponema sp.]|uniref:TIGR03546 family protein n=1 Tax=Treponema sp. TaxID=166 RepID=UPI003F096640